MDPLQALQQLLGQCWLDLFFQIHGMLNAQFAEGIGYEIWNHVAAVAIQSSLPV